MYDLDSHHVLRLHYKIYYKTEAISNEYWVQNEGFAGGQTRR